MSEVCQISKIKSEYSLKSVLSYIEYNTVLKLVKYNKCLQKKIDISIKDYSLDYEPETKKEESYREFNLLKMVDVVYKLLAVCLIFYQFVFAIVYLCIKPYKDKKEKVNIEKYFQESFGKSKIYDKIRICEIVIICLRVFLFCIHFCILSCVGFKKELFDWIAYLEALFHPISFGFYLWLLCEAYFINENQKYHWVILNLFLLVICHVVCIISFFFFMCECKCEYFRYKTEKKIYIKKFQGIEIYTLKIYDDFDEMNPVEQKRYILSKTKEMTFKKNEKNKDSIQLIKSKINECRKENKLDDLEYVDILPEFIIYGNSLVKFTLNNILKIEKKIFI